MTVEKQDLYINLRAYKTMSDPILLKRGKIWDLHMLDDKKIARFLCYIKSKDKSI